jgi:hypothetical protein
VRAWKRLAKDDVVGDVWLDDPREDTWPYARAVLTPADVLAAAVDPDRDAEARAAIGDYCLRNELLPEHEADRVVFFMLTGDHERFQATDPDGTVLAGAYQHAAERTRAALRATVVEAGDLDLVWVITNRPGGEMTAEEASYLASQLAAAGEWARLWRAIPAMPLVAAMAAAHRFEDWRPDSDTGQAYLARLLAAGPDLLTAHAQTVVTTVSTAVAREVSFAPDGSEIVVGYERGAAVHTLPGAEVTDYLGARPDEPSAKPWYGTLSPGYRDLYALGGGAVVYRSGDEPGSVIHRVPGRHARTMLTDTGQLGVARAPGGFVGLKDRTVYFATRTGIWTWTAPFAVPGVGKDVRPRLVCAEPVSGQLAFCAADGNGVDFLLLDRELRLLARRWFPGVADAAFCGPDRIVMWDGDTTRHLTVWRRAGTSIVPEAAADSHHGEPAVGPGLVVVPGPDGPVWLDPDTLAPTTACADLPSAHRTVFSADGTLVATVTSAGVDVHDMLLRRFSDLASWRLSTASPADLRAVALLGKRTRTPLVAEAVALVRAGLEHRFGHDVAIGDGVAVAAVGDDIALGGA